MKWFGELMDMSEDQVLEMSKRYSATSTQFDLGFAQKHAEGSRVWDWKSKQYVDFTSGIGWYNLGHNNLDLNSAVKEFLMNEFSNLPDHDWPHPFAAMLKKKLAEITPGNFDKKVFLARGGTEAIESALKICIENSGTRDGIYGFHGAFHGRTFGSLLLNRSKDIHWKGFVDRDEKAAALLFPEMSSDHYCTQYLNYFYGKITSPGDRREPRALFFEPVQGEGGINVPCAFCLSGVVNWFRSVGAIIVADEVQTGMMRTGTMFACEQLGIIPDVVCMAKSLSPGCHLSATVFRADLDFKEPGRNSNTGVDAKACAVALTMIDLLEKLDKETLKRKIQKLSTVAPEGLGMFRRVALANADEKMKLVTNAAHAKPTGLLLLPTGEKNVRLMPPLNISDEDLDEGLKIFRSLR